MRCRAVRCALRIIQLLVSRIGRRQPRAVNAIGFLPSKLLEAKTLTFAEERLATLKSDKEPEENPFTDDVMEKMLATI